MERAYYSTWSAQSSADSFNAISAEGVFVQLENGSRIIDFSSTSFQANFGHSFEPIKESISKQLEVMPIASPKACFELKDRATKKLLSLLGLGDGKLFYTVSGAEAVENALKIARQIKGKNIVLARERSYHGATLGALSATGDWRRQAHATIDDWTVRIPEPEDDPNLTITKEIIEATGAENIAAIILETITGANGVIIPGKAWWNGIQALCKESGIFLICDEVLCGFYRAGAPFAFQLYGLEPDVVVMSKGITGGYIPFGAVYTSAEIASYYDSEVLSCGLTNYAHPLGLAAMEAVIDTLNNENFKKELKGLERQFLQEVDKLSEIACVKETRSIGFMAAIDLHLPVASFKHFLEHGLYTVVKPDMVIATPCLTTTSEELKDGFARLKKALEALT